jgi:N-dimethylarginine dimethylaminohydrolase
MVGRLERVLVCSPRAAGWDRLENAARWRELGFRHAPNFEVAQSQHDLLCQQLRDVGAEVIELPPANDLSLDAVYAHDATLATDFGLIVLRAGKANRVAEGRHHGAFCAERGVATLGEIVVPGTAEAGDMVWLDAKTLLVGNGYRSNREGICQMREILKPYEIQVMTAPLPHGAGPSECLHLMSLISLLYEHTALVDLPWLAVESVELLKSRGVKFIEIDSAERDTLACNVLALGHNRLLAIEENQRTNQRLREAGFEVRTFPGAELCINGGGGPTCLTRPLLRAAVGSAT